jgi:hypothetical protein
MASTDSANNQSRWTKYLMFAPVDIFTSVISPKVEESLYKHSAILSAIALFCETNLVESRKTLPPNLQKNSVFQKDDFMLVNTLNSFAPYCT